MASRILVTGAAKGLGRAICLELSKRGHSIVVHYRSSAKEANETAELCQRQGVQADICQGDFSTDKGLYAFMDRYESSFSETHGLINNVGNYLIKPLSSTTEDEWCSLFQTNVNTPFFLIQRLKATLKKHRGCIVNLGTSGAAVLRARPASPAYAITKTALWHLTLSFAKEFAKDFVKVNMVSPGYLETAIDLNDPEALPMKRAASLEEVAHWIGVLFENESAYVTGQHFEIAGGVGL